jgi:hypothetical protein
MTGHDMRTTPWVIYYEDGHEYRIRAEYGWQVIGQQEPYWSVTGAIERRKGTKGWEDDSGGMIHKEVTQYFPWLVPTLKWHLSSKVSGPMHYVDNARYWLEKIHGVSKWPARSYDPNPFKSTVVFGALPEDKDLPALENLAAWCAARLPFLIKAMHQDIGPVMKEKI